MRTVGCAHLGTLVTRATASVLVLECGQRIVAFPCVKVCSRTAWLIPSVMLPAAAAAGTAGPPCGAATL